MKSYLPPEKSVGGQTCQNWHVWLYLGNEKPERPQDNQTAHKKACQTQGDGSKDVRSVHG
jgi:hypothetical protein